MTDLVRAEAGALAVRLDPQALLMEAVKGGAGIDTLERLMALAERHQSNQAKAAWHEAMALAQVELPSIPKSKKAEIKTDRAKYSYSFAPLDRILPAVSPVLGKHSLSLSWVQDTITYPDKVGAECIISHILGHQERSGMVYMPISRETRMNHDQSVGSALTYAKRYAAIAILGIAPEDDDDAHGQDETMIDEDTGEVMDEAPRLPTCPQCGRDGAVIAGKAEYGGGWLCFKKKGGCGAKWQDAPIVEAGPVTAEPTAFDQNIEDRRRLIEQIGVDGKYLGLTEAQCTVMWAKTVGPNVTLEAAPLDKLVALGAKLAEQIAELKRGQA